MAEFANYKFLITNYKMVEINNKTRSKIDLGLVRKTTEKFLKYYKLKGKEVSIAFVGDKTIKKLNKKYRGKDNVTDVLAFVGENNYLGEIVIDYAQIKRQAKRFSGGVKEELIFILVHGLLHLLGYEDETERGKKKMERLGEEFINNVIRN